jgi:predicted phosphoadenosine phosphosulfate sulfurtransferase
MSFASDLYRRSQTRRRLAHEYLAWANEDVKQRKLDRALANYRNFYDLMYSARIDLFHLRVWGLYKAKQPIKFLEAAE